MSDDRLISALPLDFRARACPCVLCVTLWASRDSARPPAAWALWVVRSRGARASAQPHPQGATHAGTRVETYTYPDTRNRERLLGATTQWAPPKVKKSKWHVKVYEFSSSKTDKLPDEDDDKDKLKLKGEGTWPWIGLRHNHDLRKIVKETPYYRFMWVYTGGVVILKAGKYTICDASDDGSKVWIEGKLEIDNDGLHSRKEVCTVMNLKAKTYYFKVAGFSADHDCVQVLKYAGPDTANRKVYVNAVGKAVPPKKKESGAKKEEGGDKKK